MWESWGQHVVILGFMIGWVTSTIIVFGLMRADTQWEVRDVDEGTNVYSRRKVGGHIWKDTLRRIARLADETEQIQLNSLATGKELSGEMRLEVINKQKEINRLANQLELYDGGE